MNIFSPTRYFFLVLVLLVILSGCTSLDAPNGDSTQSDAPPINGETSIKASVDATLEAMASGSTPTPVSKSGKGATPTVVPTPVSKSEKGATPTVVPSQTSASIDKAVDMNLDLGLITVADSAEFDIGSGRLSWSLASIQSQSGYLYGQNYDEDFPEFAGLWDKIQAGAQARTCDESLNNRAALDYSSVRNNTFEPHTIQFGTRASDCYTGPIIFEQNGAYGALDPVQINDDGSIIFEWILAHKTYVDLQIENNAPVNLGSTSPLKEFIARLTRSNPTTLHEAARNNSLDGARLLIDRGVDIDAKDNSGRTALDIAAANNALDVATLLIDRGADIEAKNNWNETALWRAAQNNSTDVATLLIDRGANTDGIDLSWMPGRSVLNNALHEAVRDNSLEVATLLIDRGADIDAKDINALGYRGSTALHIAAESNFLDVARLLIDSGANTEGIDLSWMN